MLKVPQQVCETRLFNRLLFDAELTTQLESLRSVVIFFAETTGRTVPNFTDHTIRHMDALWNVAGHVLTADEIDNLTPAEVFVLGCGFYLHDAGMAYAATEEGLKQIKASPTYKAIIAASEDAGISDAGLEARAVSAAVRRLHANAAQDLATDVIPGTDRYLFEARSTRDAWGRTCGEVASSHHWSLAALESRFGPQGVAPLPENRKGDLLYVAACLRLIDFAHINRDRAPKIERAFRFSLDEESLTHWLAQENIDGPERADNELVYRAAKPISDVEAWWLYFEMLSGLDREIRAVRRMLDQRREGFKRISLQGVRGSATPEEAAQFIPTSGFLPIEINLRTGSIDRLVELLAGETLYGPNPMAAVRELIQNARDAVMLKVEVAQNEADKALLSIPIKISLNTKSEPPTLEIIDHGVGMTRRVITDYLISIASDYWDSQFKFDFPDAAKRGFKNAGRFGIGFLSVFMLGPDVTVESNRAGEERYRLSLRGVGRRGELRQVSSPGGSGTKIRVRLKQTSLQGITPLQNLVRVYAPTLPHALSIDVDGAEIGLKVGWLGEYSGEKFREWVIEACETMQRLSSTRQGVGAIFGDDHYYMYRRRPRSYRDNDPGMRWPIRCPEYARGTDRLLASFEGISLLCLRGLAVQPVSTPGFVGVIDLDSTALDVSRNRAVTADLSEVLAAARKSVAPQVIENLNALSQNVLLLPRLPLIAASVQYYGAEVVMESEVPWIYELSMPGNAALITSRVALPKIINAPSVFIAFGAGPWTAMRRWAEMDPAPRDKEVAFLLDDTGQISPPYRSESEAARGTLVELWANYARSPLFMTLISMIAQAWQVSPEELASQKTWELESSRIYGRCVRS